MKVRKLKPKQKAFADNYIETGNATESAIEAGYSRNYANAQSYKMLDNVGIKAYIAKRMAELKTERVADQQEVMEFLSSILRGEKTEAVLRGIGKGAQTIDDMEISGSDRIKAAELIGKRHAMWTDKQQTEVTGAVQFIDDIGESDET